MEIPIVTFWMNPLSRASYEFLSGFQNYEARFNNSIEFYPIMRFQNLLKQKIEGNAPHYSRKYLLEHCYDYAGFCTPGSYENHMIEKPTTVLDEAIRQTCIFEKNKPQFYRYVKQYASNCLDGVESEGGNLNIKDCTYSIRFKLFNSTFFEEVESCFKGSFVHPRESRYRSPNKILSKYRYFYKDTANAKVPTFLIGRFAIRVRIYFCLNNPNFDFFFFFF